jgi:hypothetical protein
MEITFRIPDDLAGRLGAAGEIGHRALEALALEEYRHGRLTKPELRRLLGLKTREAIDEFLKAHETHRAGRTAREQAEPTGAAPDEARRAKARRAAANIIECGKGVTLGGLKIKDLINEGRR